MRLSHERAVSLYFMYPDLPYVTKLHWLSAEGPYIMQSTSLILSGTASARSNTPILTGTGAAASCMCTQSSPRALAVPMYSRGHGKYHRARGMMMPWWLRAHLKDPILRLGPWILEAKPAEPI